MKKKHTERKLVEELNGSRKKYKLEIMAQEMM